MYYLNDKHPKYEYIIYTRIGTGMPFLGKIFGSYTDACRYLKELAKRHEHFNQIFYIDDPFYKNEYQYNTKGFYYKILRRNVSDWKEFKEKKVV